MDLDNSATVSIPEEVLHLLQLLLNIHNFHPGLSASACNYISPLIHPYPYMYMFWVLWLFHFLPNILSSPIPDFPARSSLSQILCYFSLLPLPSLILPHCFPLPPH